MIDVVTADVLAALIVANLVAIGGLLVGMYQGYKDHDRALYGDEKNNRKGLMEITRDRGGRIDDQAERIDENEERIDENEERIDDQVERINENEERLDTHARRIRADG